MRFLRRLPLLPVGVGLMGASIAWLAILMIVSRR